MINQRTFGQQIHQTTIGDVGTLLNLQPGQIWTPPGQDGQATICQLLAIVHVDRFQVVVLVGIPGEQPDDGLEGQVGVHQSVAVQVDQVDAGPKLGLPGQKVEPPRDPGALDQLVRVEK